MIEFGWCETCAMDMEVGEEGTCSGCDGELEDVEEVDEGLMS